MMQCKQQARLKNRGFTLIETCLVILVLSLVFTPLFKIMLDQKVESRDTKEEAVDKTIVTALALYFKEYGALPCPADPTLPVNHANFGREVGRTNAQTPCGAQAAISPAPSGAVHYGMVPVAALGLPFQAAANYQGRKYLYAVSTNLTGSSTYNGVGVITVRNGATGTANITTRAPFVIVNYGADNRGAYDMNGNQVVVCPVSGNGYAENCNNNPTFRDGAYANISQIANVDYFDDSITFSLPRDENGLWIMNADAGTPTAGRMNMVNRNDGNIIVMPPAGTVPATPAKLDVQGDVRVRAVGGAGGDLNVDWRLRSQSFWYPGPPTP